MQNRNLWFPQKYWFEPLFDGLEVIFSLDVFIVTSTNGKTRFKYYFVKSLCFVLRIRVLC